VKTGFLLEVGCKGDEIPAKQFVATLLHRYGKQPLPGLGMVYELSVGCKNSNVLYITKHWFCLIRKQRNALSCSATGFYPKEINITWISGGEVLSDHVLEKPHSALELPYRFLPTAESQGMEISCVVEHRALTEPLVQSLKVELTGENIRPIVAPCWAHSSSRLGPYLPNIGPMLSPYYPHISPRLVLY
uniref:Ig-like domain-containing protein n=1 Tax=Xenopus tropicalis TaxID=8364 RepID=A0A803JQA2_XENTR